MNDGEYRKNQCFDGPCDPGSKMVCVSCAIAPRAAGDTFLREMHKTMTYPKMEVYCVINGTTPLKAFRRCGFTRFLMSAYSIKYQQAGSPATLALLNGKRWILDSGMISAWKAGQIRWANTQDYIAQLAREMHPTFVSHLDIPVEKHLLSANRISRKDAISISVRNARDFLDADVGHSNKIFSLQGWRLDEYLECLDAFTDLGIIDYVEGNGGRIGVGTMCLRRPSQGLYGILRVLREKVSAPLHVWGVGQPSYQQRLSEMGVDSTDTGSVLMQWAFQERRGNPLHPAQKTIDTLTTDSNTTLSNSRGIAGAEGTGILKAQE